MQSKGVMHIRLSLPVPSATRGSCEVLLEWSLLEHRSLMNDRSSFQQSYQHRGLLPTLQSQHCPSDSLAHLLRIPLYIRTFRIRLPISLICIQTLQNGISRHKYHVREHLLLQRSDCSCTGYSCMPCPTLVLVWLCFDAAMQKWPSVPWRLEMQPNVV